MRLLKWSVMLVATEIEIAWHRSRLLWLCADMWRCRADIWRLRQKQRSSGWRAGSSTRAPDQQRAAGFWQSGWPRDSDSTGKSAVGPGRPAARR